MANASYPSILGSSIQTTEIDALAVTTAKIAAKAVTGAKIADGTANKGMGFDASGVYAEIPKASMVLIEDYETTGAEASKVFTFTAIDFEDVSELILLIDGAATAALAVQLRINTVVSANYYDDGHRLTNSVETLIRNNAQTALTVASATMLAGAYGFSSKSRIMLEKAQAAAAHFPIIYSEANSSNTYAWERYSSILNLNQTSISSVEVRTSTSTLKAGTRISLYKVMRS